MIDRKELVEEQLLRENIRKAIRIIKNRKLQQENAIRAIVRVLLKETAQVSYQYTSLMKLNNFFVEVIGGAKEGAKTAFRREYTSLTSSKLAREEFVKYILNFAAADFNLFKAGGDPREFPSDFEESGYEEEAPQEEEETIEDEEIRVSIDDLNASGNDIVEPISDIEEEEDVLGEDPQENTPVEQESQDKSTMRSARRAYQTIGPALHAEWLNSPVKDVISEELTIEGKVYPPNTITEGDLFQIYFDINLRLWADKIEKEMPTESNFQAVEDEVAEIPMEEF